jgi:hypothetical protein
MNRPCPRQSPGDLRSQHVYEVHERRHGRNRHEHDHRRHGSKHRDPGTTGPSRQSRPGYQHTCSEASLKRRATLRDERFPTRRSQRTTIYTASRRAPHRYHGNRRLRPRQ